jgi:hypothetical protein
MTDLADRLTDLGYEGLFLRLDTAARDTIWTDDGPDALAALAADERADAGARFLAAEMLFRKLPGYPPANLRTGLAPVYATALREARIANPWGMPGELDGEAGQHLVALGEPVVTALGPLLDDTRQVWYGGSEEATEGNSYTWRVRDFAAFFISRIRGIAWTVHRDPRARDAGIEQLRARI